MVVLVFNKLIFVRSQVAAVEAAVLAVLLVR
jgi:hypothetical protein